MGGASGVFFLVCLIFDRQHVLSVRASCQPTSLSAPLAPSSSSLSISCRSSARRSRSAWVKSSPSLLTCCCCCCCCVETRGEELEAKKQKLKLCLFPPQSRRQIFCPLEKQTWGGLPPPPPPPTSHAIYNRGPAFGPA